MALQEDDKQIIRLDDGFDILQDILKKEEKPKQLSKFEKIQLFFKEHKKLAIALALLLGFLIILFIFLLGQFLSQEPTTNTQQESKILPPKFSIQRGGDIITNAENLEAWLKKANFLYSSGNKKEALDLYEKISSYSEGLSNYNLGVAQMEEKSYENALQSFQKAIDLGEDRVISSLNAAVCSLYLNQPLKYKYYLDLAETYLPYSGNLPLYSYLYALTHYYKGNYFEAFSPLTHQSSTYYQEQNNYLLSSLYAYFNDDYKAIKTLEKNSKNPNTWFNLALLYARIGDYSKAHSLITQSIEALGTSLDKEMALLLMKLQLSRFADASKILNKYANDKELINQNPYPIKISLKKDFFDVNIAQKRFWDNFNGLKLNSYKILFYFAPYKVFDAKEAFNIIQEGGINIHIENLQEAKEILLRGQTISKVNKNIANAILETLNGNIRNANKLLTTAITDYPNHSILHYNLGLNYAQMGDFDHSYQHFIRAFHLNPQDLQAGIFALITSQLTYRDSTRLNNEINQEIINLKGTKEEKDFIRALLNFVHNGTPMPLEFLETQKSNIAIYYALNFTQSILLQNQSLLISSASSLKSLLPNDPLSNLLELLALNYKDDPKSLSLKLQSYYQNPSINKEPIYYGAAVVREIYIEIAYIIGSLYYVQKDLDNRLITEQKDVRGVIQALALTYIYLQEFEKSFTLYNSLIDDFKEQDTQTLFLAAVAAVGAGHTENAATLLQLSKLEAPTNYETRIANGILYLQENNYNAAASQFTTIGNSGIISEFFDFKIDTEKLLNR
ncbi:hypothetical protein [Helicobacter pullorum]